MKELLKHLFLLFVFAVLTAHQVGAADAPPKEVPLSGKVLETMDSGGYTYLLLQNGPEKVWVAIPLTKVTVGEQLTLKPGFVMKDFTSKGLKRKFDKVVFSAGLSNAQSVALSPAALKALHAGVPGAQKNGAAPAKAAAPANHAATNGKVVKAKGPDAYTIGEIYARGGKLQKKRVVVRGRVVDVAEKIMKKNWIHLEDGTGSKAKKTNNLVVTSRSLPKVGDVVTVSGTLFNNVDFGYGYRYRVLVQDAQVK